uniref:RanBP-type and C3HC4-type zinc finger-containing protein 1 n=1 Tax=Lygus hesperus TaxID=30085 RepID=A0A0A9Z5B0_LYGHE
MYEANRLQRQQSTFIPMIAEVSESTVTSPASTVANTPSEPIAPPIPGTSATPVITPSEQSKALERVPVQLPASALKPVVHVVWNCPRCTLENPRWKITCEACDMWRPVPCEFKEVKPKHPLPLAVLRIVEPKDQKRPGTIEITELKDDEPANNVSQTNGIADKSDEPKPRKDKNLDLRDNKTKRSSQGLTISDLLFNTQGNSTPKDNTWYKDILNGLNLPPSTTTYKEYTNNLQRKLEQSEKPLNTTKLPPESNVPTPSASGSSISSLSSTNSEKPSTSSAALSFPKGDIVEPEEIRKARLAFFEKYGQPSTSQAKQDNNLSSESKIKGDATKTQHQGKINETSKLSSSSKTSTPVVVTRNEASKDSKLPTIDGRKGHAENLEIRTEEKGTGYKEQSAEDRLKTVSKSPDFKPEMSPTVKTRSISRNEEISVKDTQTTDITYKPCLSNDQEEDRKKLREMLKEMKHSLPKRSKDEKGAQKSNNDDNSQKAARTDEVKNEIRSPKLGAIRKIVTEKSPKPIENNYKHGPSDKAEAYLVESETIVEEIKMKKPLGKTSSSAQTTAMVRQLTPQAKPPSGKEVIVPITVEEYQIKDGVLYTSVTKKAKRIGSGTFQLMRPRDFANIKAIKTKVPEASAPLYANMSPEAEQPSNQGASSKSKEVEQLSLQLTEPQGLAHFRAGLATTNDTNNMNTIAVNRLLRRLESAIANGQHELAAALAKELAQLKVNCVVTRQKPEAPTSQIQVDMYVEDKEIHQGPFPLQLKPSTTIEQLKMKVEREYEIPCGVQRWIIGKALANEDKASLESLGVTESGSAVYLYLVVPEDPAALTVPTFSEKNRFLTERRS